MLLSTLGAFLAISLFGLMPMWILGVVCLALFGWLSAVDAYEANAKRLITTWGGFQEDYAARFWSGLIKDYYIPRMKLYFSEQRADLDRWEENWIKAPWHNTSTSFEDPLQSAIKLVERYKGE